jgi:hypothetical protein
MKRKILILSVFVMLLSCYSLVKHYGKFEEKSYDEKISNFDALLKQGLTTTAYYDSVYYEFKRRGQVKGKFIKYSFKANRELFNDEKQISIIPNTDRFSITYLPSDPSIHSEDPLKEKTYFQKLKEKKSSSLVPWLFLFLSIAVFYFIRKLTLKELAERKEIEELSKQYNK